MCCLLHVALVVRCWLLFGARSCVWLLLVVLVNCCVLCVECLLFVHCFAFEVCVV